VSAGGPVAACFSAFGEEIGRGLVGLGTPRRQARGCTAVDVVEDLADEVGIGDICDYGWMNNSGHARGWKPGWRGARENP